MTNLERATKLQKKIKRLKTEYDVRICIQIAEEGYNAPDSTVMKTKLLLIQQRLSELAKDLEP